MPSASPAVTTLPPEGLVTVTLPPRRHAWTPTQIATPPPRRTATPSSPCRRRPRAPLPRALQPPVSPPPSPLPRAPAAHLHTRAVCARRVAVPLFSPALLRLRPRPNPHPLGPA
nr:classical arabinogalactan protein 9-like [Aegilops tauschii subsp. strangulata]